MHGEEVLLEVSHVSKIFPVKKQQLRAVSDVSFTLEKGELLAPPGKEEKRELILRHAAMLLACKGEYTAVREMRKHLAWYTAGMPHSARFRSMINAMETMEMLTESVEQICISETQDA